MKVQFKKYIITLIVIAILSVVCSLKFWGYIYLWHSTNFFLLDSSFFIKHIIEPMGLTHYIAAFITEAFQWKFAGGFILVLLPTLLFFFSKKVINIKNQIWGYIISLLITIPAVIGMMYADIYVEQISIGTTVPIAILGFLCSLSIIQYGEKRAIYIQPITYTISFILSYMFAGIWAIIICLAYILISNIVHKRKIWLSITSILLSSLIVLIWREYITIIPYHTLWNLPLETEYTTVAKLSLIPIIGITIITLFSKFINANYKYLLSTCALLIGAIIILRPDKLESKENLYRINYYASAQEWSSIVDYAKGREILTRDEQFFVMLALNNLGTLGSELFNFPIYTSQVITYEKNQNYQYSLSKAEQYHSVRLLNSTIHQFFQAATATKHKLDNRTIKPLIEHNIQANSFDIANKYLDILENTLFNKAYIKSQRELIVEKNKRPNVNINYPFFIGTRYFTSNLARVVDESNKQNSTNRLAIDYILCSLLLDKDLDRFCGLLNISLYSKQEVPLPRAYQEAVLIAQLNEIPSVMKYVVNPTIIDRFTRFNSDMEQQRLTQAQRKQVMKVYEDTWWYHFKFRNVRNAQVQTAKS